MGRGYFREELIQVKALILDRGLDVLEIARKASTLAKNE